MTNLVVRVEAFQRHGRYVLVADTLGYMPYLRERAGEFVVLGRWDAMGVWQWLAVVRYSEVIPWAQNGLLLVCTDINELPSRAVGITGSYGEAEPYNLDEIQAVDLDRLRATAVADEDKSSGYGFSEGGAEFAADMSVLPSASPTPAWFGDLGEGDESAYGHIGACYAWRCAITGLQLHSESGAWREGVAVPALRPELIRPIAVSEGLYLSRTVAFCYAHGMVAITGDYEIWCHPAALPEEVARAIRALNPHLRLHLPSRHEHWPQRGLLVEQWEAIRR